MKLAKYISLFFVVAFLLMGCMKEINTIPHEESTEMSSENLNVSDNVAEDSDESDGMFIDCSSLKKIEIPESIHTIGSYAFDQGYVRENFDYSYEK